MNVVDLLEHQARAQPQAPAWVTPTEVIGFGEAAHRVRRLAAALLASGLRAGQRVAVCLPTSPAHLVTPLALGRIGAVAVPLFPRRPPDVLQAQAASVGAVAAIGAGPNLAIAGLRGIDLQSLTVEGADLDEAVMPPAGGDDDLFCIVWSSGTTGPPRPVGWSHRRMLQQYERMQTLRPHGPGVRLLVFMGYDASYSMQAALRMLWSGGAVVIVPDTSLRSLAEGIDRLGAQHVLSSPGVIGRLVGALPAGARRFPGLQSLHLGGGAVPPALHAALLQRLCPVVCVNAGTSEVGGLSFGVPGLLERVPGSSGRVSPWVRAEAVDAEGRSLPPGDWGELRFQSDDFPAAELGPAWRDGWYHPGDCGRVLADGTLIIDSRVDDLVNLGGMKIVPAEVEALLLSLPGVTEAAAYGVEARPGELRLLVAVVCSEDFDRSAALALCRARLGRKAPYALLRVPRLPRNPAGKVMRRVLAARTRFSPTGTAAAATMPADVTEPDDPDQP